MNRTLFSTLVASAVTGIAGLASADVLTAGFTYNHSVRVTIASTPVTGNVSAVDFHWTRTDAPGPGVDAAIAPSFVSFCIELDQNVRANMAYQYQVLSPAQAGLSADQELALASLWASHIADAATANGAAAFQLAVWELRYDSDRNLATGAFTASSPSAAIATAQAWLSEISADTGIRSLPSLVVLRNDDSQDQLTSLVPEPGAIACCLAGLGMLKRRRRR